MIKGHLKRFAWVVLAGSIAAIAPASAAVAEKEHHPTGAYEQFNECPTENPKSSACILARSTGGEFQIGKLNIPITKPIVLQGALTFNSETEEDEFFPATDGESLVRAPQVVSGGIFAVVKEGRYPLYLRNFCKNFPDNSECKVTATAELVGQPFFDLGHLIEQQGTALEIPLRIHLKNPFLGGKCYIGSASNPVTPIYTTGSRPALGAEPEIKGQFGHLEFTEGIIVDNEANLVDNTYPVPKAEGCGGPQSLIVDREIDEKQALPSPAGQARARLTGTLYLVGVEAVLESEA